MKPVLKNVYARIDIVSFTDGKFGRHSSVYMLGEHSKLAPSTKDISLSNKKLVAAIGAAAVKELVGDMDMTGGDGNWEELDELDIEDLLNTETTPIDTTAKPVVAYDNLRGDIISDVVLYAKDKQDDIKEKIAIESGILPYKQHVWIPSANVSIDGDEINLFKHYEHAHRMVEGYPVDSYVKQEEELTSHSIDTYAVNDVVVMYCVSLDALVPNKSKLLMMSKSDTETFEMIFNNAINVFFKSIDIVAFTQYLTNEDELDTKYPQLSFDKSAVMAKLQLQKKILPELNAIPPVLADDTKLLTISTTSILIRFSSQTKRVMIDTTTLFKVVDITECIEIVAMDLYNTDVDRKNMRLRKIQQFDQYRESLTLANISFPFDKRELLYNRCIIIFFMPTTEYSEIMLIIDQNCNVWVKATPNKSLQYTKKEFIGIITPLVNKTITLLNAQESAFMTMEKIPLMNTHVYQISSSSSRLVFKYAVDYSKLVNLMIDQLADAGFLDSSQIDGRISNRMMTTFSLKYGVSRNSHSKMAQINIKNINGVAMIELLDLDMDETNLYVDIIGRVIVRAGDSIRMKSGNSTDLVLVDPVLYNMQSTNNYSRICQKKFQPVITTKGSKNAVEYHNFTFDRPEYYSCPDKDAPELGFIQGKHERGFCLPCCRKTPQVNVDETRALCTMNEAPGNLKQSSYKIDYPIKTIPNSKVMNRRIQLPDYLIHMFGGTPLVANGTIMLTHVIDLAGANEDVKSYLQAPNILTAVDRGDGEPMFKSVRSFILSLIEFIKNPQLPLNIMRHPVIHREFSTPTALIHALEDKYIKHSVIPMNGMHISDMEWNDMIIFLANSMRMNILVVSDDRQSDLQIHNFQDIDVSRPVIILLKRLNIEWSLLNQNTKAMYLPITTTAYKITARSQLRIEYIDISTALQKIQNAVFSRKDRVIARQFTARNIGTFTDTSRQYKLLDVIQDQKLAVIGIGTKKMVATTSTIVPTLTPRNINVKPTATLNDALLFIKAYNKTMDDDAFGLRLNRYIQVDGSVVGIIIDVMDDTTVVSSELLFVNPTKPTRDMNDRIIEWLQHPLYINYNPPCTNSIGAAFNEGAYMLHIYKLAAIDVMDAWKKMPSKDLKEYVLKFVKANDKIPINQPRIDTMITEIEQKLPNYDKDIVREMLYPLFDDINTLDKSQKAAISRVEKSEIFNGADLPNLHRWSKPDILAKITSIMSEISVDITKFPTFLTTKSILDQRELFYNKDKICIYKTIRSNLLEFMAADLTNPFRRDFIINMQHTLSTVEDIRPHIGEIIYIRHILN